MVIRKLFLLFFLLPFISNAQKPISTAKPWAYWWWMGSAVDEKNITANLEDYAKAGFGGMHIIPIYGVKGEESKFIPYLSDKWMAMLEYTVKEANRLGLGIDMTVGTGWPFGGKQVTEQDAAKAFKIKKDGEKYTLEVIPTKQMVKRAAPGGEGFVVDHFDADALTHYFRPFDSLFSIKNIGVRAFYNDSYEVYGANWTPKFFEKFKILRGYDLANHLDVLAKDTAITDREKRIWSDYHETLSDLLLEVFTKKYVDFAHKFGKIARNESHGSPANILDLYAVNDVPESEFFGSKPYDIPLYKQDEEYEVKRFGTPGGLILKLASSAANVSGKKLVASETSTWLGNHFKVSLKQIKPIIDESFVSGINHVFYHGMPYSPKEAQFPGWLFYASTNFNQQSHFWEHLPQLNNYIERCQSLLQNTSLDNDVLLYFPIYDQWHSVGRSSKMHPIDVHAILREGMFTGSLGRIANEMLQKGYTFDFVSDRQLVNFSTQPKNLKSYKAIVVPPIKYLPLKTLEALNRLKQAGVLIVFCEKLPETVNGFNDLENRQASFDKLIKNFTTIPSISAWQTPTTVRRETMAEYGLQFIRKKASFGTLYFITNPAQKFQSGKIKLSANGVAIRLFNPLFNRRSTADFKKIGENQVEISLDLLAGESIFIEVLNQPLKSTTLPKSDIRNLKSEIPIVGTWQVDFLKGEPALPKSFKTDKLDSWTNASDTMVQYFSGKARYTTHFKVEKDKLNKMAWIDLGDVRESAEVKLNGKSLGIAWCLPMRLPIIQGLLKEDNLLEIEVINLSANRMRYIDRKDENWQKFYDINMVDIGYHPFDASNWKVVPSGLLGGVKLIF